MSNIAPVDSHDFAASDSVFLDACVWLAIHVPQFDKAWRTQVYSSALNRALAAGSRLFVDTLVLSEFINRYARLEHGLAKRRGGPEDFRAYKQTVAYGRAATAIADACRRILGHAQCIDTCLTQMDMNAALADYETGRFDFNDQMMAETCRCRGLTLVTHDAGLTSFGIPVLTANSQMLH